MTRGQRLRFALVYAAAWVPHAVITALLVALRGVPVRDAVESAIHSVGFAALLGLAVWRMARVLAWPPRRRSTFFLAHLALAIVYAALWDLFIIAEIWVFAPRRVFTDYVANAAGWQFLNGLIVYGLVAGAAYAIQIARRLREHEAAAARADALRVRAELQALKAQLNPHFLFNTLHSITALVRTDPDAVEDALERFGGLLRYALDVNRAERDDVALGDEWSFVRGYLALEQFRLGDRLRVIEELDVEAFDCAVLSFTLQPLVENAIRHGIAPRAKGGTLRLAAAVNGNRLQLEVGDDGNGADLARTLRRPGLGLSAVRQRLTTRYGGRATMEIVTAPGNGFLVRIGIPLESAPAAVTEPAAVGR